MSALRDYLSQDRHQSPHRTILAAAPGRLGPDATAAAETGPDGTGKFLIAQANMAETRRRDSVLPGPLAVQLGSDVGLHGTAHLENVPLR
ncbi:hypothetical protein [Luteimonas sp. R10]|uniref:hypothetical protein n=1 Tax=Luteimonas sp. R10 TaxID=3108176 RepID=UPI00308C2EF4|nr:hypothetical protein U3649_03650 [Luteimonas sp. R10]